MKRIITVLVVIIIAIAGGVGFAIYRQHNDPAVVTPVITNAPQQNPESQPTNPATPVAVSQVQQAYDAVLVYAGSGKRTPQGEVDSIKSYLSDDYYTELARLAQSSPDSDRILCAQSVPTTAMASLSSTSQDATAVLVAETFGATTTKVTVNVDPASGKITNIACP